ncbi:hypothetical protein BX070DRAFT_248580 [Coemansia spiralis]|nr:hypothetical protein BX070DRAFT_248580 [Coemansia spiralis]
MDAASSELVSITTAAISSTMLKCIPLPTYVAASESVPKYSRIIHPAILPTETTKAYEILATLSTAFTDAEEAIYSSTQYESSSSSSSDDTLGLESYVGGEAMLTERSAQIFCLNKKCTKDRDWLTKMPKAAAGWTIGAVSLVLGIILFVPTLVWRNTDFLDGVFALTEVCISLFLRAALNTTSSNQDIIYKASIFFNYHAAIELCFVLVVMIIRLHAHYNPLISMKQVFSTSIARFVSVCLSVLVLVGVLLMFGSSSNNVTSSAGPGMHLLQAVSFFIAAACLAFGIFTLQLTSAEGSWYYKKHYAVLFISLILMALWGAYTSARTFVPLNNVARDSEVMFYLLNILPLIIIGAVFIVLRAPLLFNFEMTAHWKSKV